MRSTKTEKRLSKIVSVVKARQNSLRVVMENIHDPHNVSAIFRTCDAVGIPKISLIYNSESFPRIGKKSSASAYKWVEKEKFKSVEECFQSLRDDGFRIYSSSISNDSKSLYDLDFTKKAAIVVGNEHRGVSDEAANLSDEKFLIPQFGMVQSLNVSVATAVILYEALRQRRNINLYSKSDFSDSEIDELVDKWCRK